MDKKTLLEILRTEPFSFTLREIEEIMDEEMSKAPKDMDTDLVDLCADILNREYFRDGRTGMEKNLTFDEQMQLIKAKAEAKGYTVIAEGSADAPSNAQYQKMAEDNLKEPKLVII